MNKRSISLTVIGAALALGLGTTIAGAAPADNPDHKIYWCYNSTDSSKNYVQFRPGQPVACKPGYTRFSFSGQGPAGGLTVSASTYLPDGKSPGGDWATTDIMRVATVSRQAQVPADACGQGATTCWSYVGSVTDNGSFRTIAGSESPINHTPITQVYGGDMHGMARFTFRASSDTPRAVLVPFDTPSGSTPAGVQTWYKQFFPASTKFVQIESLYNNSYTLPQTCERLTLGYYYYGGDISGTNSC